MPGGTTGPHGPPSQDSCRCNVVGSLVYTSKCSMPRAHSIETQNASKVSKTAAFIAHMLRKSIGLVVVDGKDRSLV